MKRGAAWSVLVIAILLASLAAGCGGGSRNDTADYTANYSGKYYVCLGSIDRLILEISRDGSRVTFTTRGGRVMPMDGNGTIQQNRLTLRADLGALGILTIDVTTQDNGETFSGNAGIAGQFRMESTITGSRAPWPTYDLDRERVPNFVTHDAIDLAAIAKVSKFRSGEGHDYSDDFESCRSMKHYYYPKDGVDRSTVRLYAPVTGTVIGTIQEYEGGTIPKGTQVGIRPDGHPAFWVIIFHVDLAAPLAVGDRVTAGKLLGTSAKRSGTVTDVAVWVHTPSGDRLISFFDCMTDSVFGIYNDRGVLSRQAAIITRDERDADPLTCTDEDFGSPGNIPNWVELN